MAHYEETARNAGLVETRRSRQTGTLVSIYRAEQAGLDADGCAYAVVCEQHATILSAPTMAYARRFAPVPKEFCEYCRDGEDY